MMNGHQKKKKKKKERKKIRFGLKLIQSVAIATSQIKSEAQNATNGEVAEFTESEISILEGHESEVQLLVIIEKQSCNSETSQ